MTLIATYRLDDRAIYVNDFRVTMNNPSQQLDISFKFADFDKRLGLFFSGDVNLWRELAPTITQVMPATTLTNILDPDGPFRTALQKSIESYPSNYYRYSKAIGFIIDNITRQNIQFTIAVHPGMGCIIQEIEPSTCVIIGSGSSIPIIHSLIPQILQNEINNGNTDLYDLGTKMRHEIQVVMQKCGSSIYTKLGISPCMAISTLAASHFMIRGEELNGGFISPYENSSYSFQFTRNSSGQIALINKATGEENIVSNIYNLTPYCKGTIFDPQGLSTLTDPSLLYTEANFAYLFSQFFIPEHKFIYRKIERINFISLSGNSSIKICDPNYIKISEDTFENCDADSCLHFTTLDKGYFTLNSSTATAFEKDIQTNLFNHHWLNDIIPNYSMFYS